MPSFLKLLRSRAFIVTLTLVIITLSFQLTLSSIIYKSKPKIEQYLNNTFGYRVTINKISFNFLKGICLNEVSVFYKNQDRAPIFLKGVSLYVKILPIFLGRITLDIKIKEALLLTKKEKEGYNLQIMFSDTYKKIFESKVLKSNIFTNNVDVFIDLAKLIYMDNPNLEKNMYILLKNAQIQQKSEKFKFTSDIEFNYRLPEDGYLSRFIKDITITQRIKCAIQGNIQGNDLNMELVSLNIGKEQMLGMGINKGFAEKNPYIDIIFISSTITVNNIKFMKDNFDAKGHVFFSIKLNGLLDNIKTTITGILDDCYFSYALKTGESFKVKNLRGEFEYKNKQIKLTNGYLKLNDFPVDFILQANISYEPDIMLDISLPKEFLYSHNIPLNRLEAILKGKIKKTFMGNFEINALYIRKGMELDMQAYFKNVDFDYANKKEKYFRAGAVELIKKNIYKIQKLNFTNLKSKVLLSKNKIAIKELNLTGYNGILNGRMNLDIGDRSKLMFALNGLGLDVKTLMQDINITDKLLSGSMNMNIIFDNHLKEFLKGRCYIKDGVADLDVLAAIVKVPPLKSTSFNIMHAYFSIAKDSIKVRGIKLDSPDIMLNAYWDTNSRINGIFNAKISSELLNNSVQFRKLLNLTKIKKPYIDFKFLLGGLPDAVRFMWMKSEFKEKLESALPAGIKGAIQANLDETIEELSNK